MRVLHITPHLGGGVGKAHITIGRHLPSDIKQTFLLLERPIDQRCVHFLRSMDKEVIVAENLEQIAQLAAKADVVQIEFTNHPRLLHCLARTDFPYMRSIIWAHISGLHTPIIQPGLMDIVNRFVFSSSCSVHLAEGRENVSYINSGFGFHTIRKRATRQWPLISYLGTVNFVKMHPGFFDVVDKINHVGPVQVWGAVDKAVSERHKAMKNPRRVEFYQETQYPDAALAQSDIFFYPLQPRHYGTGENALVEAMSMGLVPIVLNNEAESCIVKHNINGLVANSIEECPALIETLCSVHTLREELSKAAVKWVAEHKRPEKDANKFANLWRKVGQEQKRKHDFASIIGKTPLDWFFSTQNLRGTVEPIDESEFRMASKGTLAHFKKVFAGELGL